MPVAQGECDALGRVREAHARVGVDGLSVEQNRLTVVVFDQMRGGVFRRGCCRTRDEVAVGGFGQDPLGRVEREVVEGGGGEYCFALCRVGIEEHLGQPGQGLGLDLFGARDVLGQQVALVELPGPDPRRRLLVDRGAHGGGAYRIQE